MLTKSSGDLPGKCTETAIFTDHDSQVAQRATPRSHGSNFANHDDSRAGASISRQHIKCGDRVRATDSIIGEP
jgi:hypothetical protein